MTDSKPSFGNRLSNLLTGRFLINPKVIQQWPFILFLCFLALIMTASSHSAERKVHRIASLRSEMKELHSEFIDTRSELMSESMDEAVRMAYKMGEKGDAVLLSPACASFDLFENYEDRGRQFKHAVRQL